MNITFFITGRQNGKTHLAIYEYMKDPYNSLLILWSRDQINSILKQIPELKKYNTIISINDLKSGASKGKQIKKLIIDEYLFHTLENRKLISNMLIPAIFIDGEIICFSSPKIQYNKKLFDIIKYFKAKGSSLPYSSQFILELYFAKCRKYTENIPNAVKQKLKLEIDDLYYNLITAPTALIINNDFFNIQKRQIAIKEGSFLQQQRILGDRFETEFNGKFLTD